MQYPSSYLASSRRLPWPHLSKHPRFVPLLFSHFSEPFAKPQLSFLLDKGILFPLVMKFALKLIVWTTLILSYCTAAEAEAGSPGQFLAPKVPLAAAVPAAAPVLQKRQKSRNWCPSLCFVWNYFYEVFGRVFLNQICLNCLQNLLVSRNLIRLACFRT